MCFDVADYFLNSKELRGECKARMRLLKTLNYDPIVITPWTALEKDAKRFIDNELAGAGALGLGKISDHEINLLENPERNTSLNSSAAIDDEKQQNLDSDDDWDSDDSDDERS